MKIITSISEMQQLAQQERSEGKRIALVPTMGFLHEGHLSLIRLAKEKADIVVVSIYVNPTQFGPNEDFSSYPRDFEKDVALCEAAGAHLVFNPPSDEMYAEGHTVTVVEEVLSSTLCGVSRPGHFNGVATVVLKLFNLTLPHLAVFGEKDAQQLRLIKKMVKELHVPVEIVAGPLVREEGGLALSSRNSYLSQSEKIQALCLSESLVWAEKMLRNGEKDLDKIKLAMVDVINQNEDAIIDYIAFVDDNTLQELIEVRTDILIMLAVYIGKTRLIDNRLISLNS